jgi:hypothetical protein
MRIAIMEQHRERGSHLAGRSGLGRALGLSAPLIPSTATQKRTSLEVAEGPTANALILNSNAQAFTIHGCATPFV